MISVECLEDTIGEYACKTEIFFHVIDEDYMILSLQTVKKGKKLEMIFCDILEKGKQTQIKPI
jgi:hypothetical protein